MTKSIARTPIYRRRAFDADIIQICVRWYINCRLSCRELMGRSYRSADECAPQCQHSSKDVPCAVMPRVSRTRSQTWPGAMWAAREPWQRSYSRPTWLRTRYSTFDRLSSDSSPALLPVPRANRCAGRSSVRPSGSPSVAKRPATTPSPCRFVHFCSQREESHGQDLCRQSAIFRNRRPGTPAVRSARHRTVHRTSQRP